MKAIEPAVEHDRGRRFRHPGIGNLHVPGPIGAVQDIVPELAVVARALVETIDCAVVDHCRRRFGHAGRRHLPVALPKDSIVDIVKQRAVGGETLVEAIDAAGEFDRRRRRRHSGIGDRGVGFPAVVFGDAAPQPALLGDRLMKDEQIGIACVWHPFPIPLEPARPSGPGAGHMKRRQPHRSLERAAAWRRAH